MSAQDGWGPRIAALVISLGMTFVLAEIGLRLAGIGYPFFYEADPITGGRHIPLSSGWFKSEGEAFISINSQGIRDHEHTLEKPESVYRIAVLGDSYSEALQVDIDATFWSLLESEMLGCEAIGDRVVEAINFGVSGFGTAQELRVLRHKALLYEPDLILLAFVLNDVRNNSRELERGDLKPYFTLENGELILDDSFLQSAHYLDVSSTFSQMKVWLTNRSRVLQLVYEVRRIPYRMKKAKPPAEGVKLDDGAFFPPKAEAWIDAWRVTEALISQIQNETFEQEIGFLLVVVSDGNQVHPDPAVRRSRAEALGVDDLYYYEDRILSYAREAGIANLGLARPFLRRAEVKGECLHGFDNAQPCEGHWNELGHKFASELMAEAVCKVIAERNGSGKIE